MELARWPPIIGVQDGEDAVATEDRYLLYLKVRSLLHKYLFSLLNLVLETYEPASRQTLISAGSSFVTSQTLCIVDGFVLRSPAGHSEC